jgi:serine phosphatase RsbU (regulator of sigma subunit)
VIGLKRVSSFGLINLAPFAIIALAAGIDLATPRSLQFDRLMSAAPALAASMLSVWATLSVGLLALVVEIGLADYAGALGQSSHSFTLAVIATVTGASCLASGVRQRRELTLCELRSVAETAQKVLLRAVPRSFGHVSVDTLYLAAAAQARIGGDFYEVMRTPYGVRLLIGDVCGKGLPAVEIAAVMLASFREAAHDEPDLPQLARRLERSMDRHTEQSTADNISESFVTAVLAEIPEADLVVRIVNCGHPPPLLLHDGKVREVEPTTPSPPINMGALLGDDYCVDVVPFAVGDQLLLYTDGVSETRDLSGEFYPLIQRVCPWADAPGHEILDRLRRDLAAYSSGNLTDDIAAVATRRLPTS